METAPPRPRILTRLAVVARDGASLSTDVYLPARPEPRPAVLMRTPYGRNAPFMQWTAVKLSAAGFATVLQDSRGRYQSDGEFELPRESADGHDTLAWLARQEWCDGRVGLIGMSITSYPCFLLAASPPPDGIRIETMVNMMGAFNLHRLFYRDGALLLHWALPWCLMMSPSQMGRTNWKQLPWAELYRHLPLSETLQIVDGQARGLWPLVVKYPACEGFWEDLDAGRSLDRMAIPVLHLGGWYDFLLMQVLMAYERGRQAGRAPQKLVVGPWDHQTLFAAIAPPKGTRPTPASSINMLAVIVEWLERHLGAPAAPAEPDGAGALLYLMGRDTWLAHEAYPPAGVRVVHFYLASDGRANGVDGGGRLLPEAPADAGQDAFVYDPERPVPTVGGAVWPFADVGLAPGPADQSEVEARDDVLVYTGAPLAEELIVIGEVRLELWASSSAHDTDFTAKLVDVSPLGVPRIVQDGIVRARFRSSPRDEALLEPHRPTRFEIALQATAHSFARGHRLRLEVSSSNFPKFERNLNTVALRSQTPTPATQCVFHGGPMPSRLSLSVLPAPALRPLEPAAPV